MDNLNDKIKQLETYTKQYHSENSTKNDYRYDIRTNKWLNKYNEELIPIDEAHKKELQEIAKQMIEIFTN
jgi:hypothetical protein